MHLPRSLHSLGHSAFVMLFGGVSLLLEEDISHADVFFMTKSSHESCNIAAVPHTMDDTPVY